MESQIFIPSSPHCKKSRNIYINNWINVHTSFTVIPLHSKVLHTHTYTHYYLTFLFRWSNSYAFSSVPRALEQELEMYHVKRKLVRGPRREEYNDQIYFEGACIISLIACSIAENHHSFLSEARAHLTRVFDLLIRIRQIIIFIFILMIKRPG